MPNGGLTSLLWFIAILALIPVALWLLKRTPAGGMFGGAGGGGTLMRSVASLPLSASQRIVAVEIGQGEARRWLVLGVTPGSITTLHTMEPQDAALPPAAPLPGFAQLLAKLQQPKGDGDAR